MKDETNKIVNWIEMGYTRLNYKEELSLVDYIKQLQQENQKYKEVIDKAIDFIDCHFKEMVADEEAQELKSILKEVE